MTGLEDEVAENRREARKLDSFFREPVPQGTESLAFAPITVEISVEFALETRSLQNSLISGHPDPKHGSGRGVSGDRRGAWTTEDTVTGTVTIDGRESHADALAAAAVGIGTVQLGSGTTDPGTSDTSLANGTDKAFAWYDSSRSEETDGIGIVGFSDVPSSVGEFGVFDTEGRLLARATLDATLSVPDDEEARVTATLSYEGLTSNSETVTDLDAIADLIATDDDVVGIDELELGTDGSTPSTTDSGTRSTVVTKPVELTQRGQTTRVVATVFDNEPSTQPHDLAEVALVDNNDRALSLRTFDPVTKDSLIAVRVSDGIQFR